MGKHMNIRATKFNTFNVQIVKEGRFVYCKSFKTLDEAIEGRDNFKNGNDPLMKKHMNIKETKFNTFSVQIMRNGNFVYCKTFKTLEEAIEGRDNFKN
tara:strand:- start:1560 stop:1853 length:294 start_codon:yes stop_codon:yes gene_type:complete